MALSLVYATLIETFHDNENTTPVIQAHLRTISFVYNMAVSNQLSYDCGQWIIRWVGGEDQAQIESYIEIQQPYPSNHANSRHKLM